MTHNPNSRQINLTRERRSREGNTANDSNSILGTSLFSHRCPSCASLSTKLSRKHELLRLVDQNPFVCWFNSTARESSQCFGENFRKSTQAQHLPSLLCFQKQLLTRNCSIFVVFWFGSNFYKICNNFESFAKAVTVWKSTQACLTSF